MEGARGPDPQMVELNLLDLPRRSRRPGRGAARANPLLIVTLALAGGATLAGAAMFCFVIFVSHAAAPGAGELAAANKASNQLDQRLALQTPAAKSPDASRSAAGNHSATPSPAPIAANNETSGKPTAASFQVASALDHPAPLELSADADASMPAPQMGMPGAMPDGLANPNAMPPAAPQQPGWLANANGAQPPGMAAGAAPARVMPGDAMAGPGMPVAALPLPPAVQPPVANARLRRRMLVLGEGGTPQSEQAVEAALIWLTAHQMPDGGWNFNHQLAGCGMLCPNPGDMDEARIGATAMALLPFLAAGYSYDEGQYQREISAGLVFLMTHMAPNGSLWEPSGRMYSHGLATLALCDAYNLGPKADYSPGEMAANNQALGGKRPKLPDERAARAEAAKLLKAAKATLAKSRKGPGRLSAEEAASPGQAAKFKLNPMLLGEAAQAAIDFIVAAQDPRGGGWRYDFQQPGDTSVVGWQLMALKAGEKARLRVPAPTLALGAAFLDSVQTDYGSAYGYTTAMRGTPATTAIGLLARMNLGWDRSHPGLAAGAQNVAALGPSPDDMYFNFYASQVLRNFGGPVYEKWNPIIRDFLVKTQGNQGHMQGSWEFTGGHGSSAGGRLYNTVLCTLILEIYYRYEPIYAVPESSPGEIAAAEEAARRKRRLPAMD